MCFHEQQGEALSVFQRLNESMQDGVFGIYMILFAVKHLKEDYLGF